MNAEAIIPAVVISVDKTGHRNQCRAFCDLMGWPVREEVLIPGSSVMDPIWWRKWVSVVARKRTMSNAPNQRRWNRLRVVASGSSSENLASQYRKLYGMDLFAVFVGSPKSKVPVFDLAIASHHALKLGEIQSGGLYKGAGESLWIAGVLTRAVPHMRGREGENLIVALIGGLNKSYMIDPEKITEQLSHVHSRKDQLLAVVFSRRTSQETELRLKEIMNKPNVIFVDRGDRTGFENAFAQASEFYVTPDSITMICEACSSKRPVTVFDLTCFNPVASTARFVNEFAAARYVRTAGDTGPTAPLPSLEPLKNAVTTRFQGWVGA